MISGEDWRNLLPRLETWAQVRVLDAGVLELTSGGSTRELHLTPDQWDGIEAVVCGGDTETAAGVIRHAWNRAAPDQRYLVYDGQYGIEPSDTAAWVDPGREAFRKAVERARERGGDVGWFASPPGEPR